MDGEVVGNVQRKVGPAWTERGLPPAGYFTKHLAPHRDIACTNRTDDGLCGAGRSGLDVTVNRELSEGRLGTAGRIHAGDLLNRREKPLLPEAVICVARLP